MKNKKWFYGIGIVFFFIVLSIFLFSRNSLPVNKDAWQAVFLTNNQVYFGKLSFLDKENAKLENVFYLQSDQSLNGDQKDAAGINLIKLGAEIHGPEDVMYITQKQIIFWENLKQESKIVKIIDSYR